MFQAFYVPLWKLCILSVVAPMAGRAYARQARRRVIIIMVDVSGLQVYRVFVKRPIRNTLRSLRHATFYALPPRRYLARER
jgi:hypothetical protein